MVWNESSSNVYNLSYQLQPTEKFPFPLWAPTPVGKPPDRPSQFKISRDCIFDLRFHYRGANVPIEISIELGLHLYIF
jgi:hypothetical protein